MPGRFTIAGRYEIERVIGSGGMGIVYEVTHLVTGRRHALKTLRGGLDGDASLVARILDESKVTAGIDSEHIVRVTDGGIDEETRLPFLVMELLEGASVAEELARRGGLPAAEVVDLMRQASLALGKTHAAGVIHRDLKPENLFLARSDEGSVCLKILDFGIAKTIETGAGARTTRNIGTPVYMSPEQFRGDGDIDQHADIYALGHVAFALLTGHPYWVQEAHAGTYALMRKVLEGTHEPATRRAAALGVSLPRAFDRWFDQATARAAARRYHDVVDLVDGLAVALGVDSLRSSGAASARGWRRRVGSITIAGAAIVAAFTVVQRPWRGSRALAPPASEHSPPVASRTPAPSVVADLSTLVATPPSPPPHVRVRLPPHPKTERLFTSAAAPPIKPADVCAAGDRAVGAAPAAFGARVIIWDGDRPRLDGQGWESCDRVPGCHAKIRIVSEAGVKGSKGLVFHGEGLGWIGFGWNLFGWFPVDAGVDLKPYSHLTFQIRVEARSPDEAPDPGAFNVVLGGSANKNDSASIPVERYAHGFTDGKWHEVAIPIAQLVKGEGRKFDLGSFWEFRISTWSPTPRSFDIYFDDIAVEQRCPT